MLNHWDIDGKSGEVWFAKGQVVYQKKGIVEEPLYQTGAYDPFGEHRWYIEENGKLLEVMYNPFNGYCYRQDGE